MSKALFVVTCLILSATSLHAQSRLGFSTGIAFDLNNSGKFKQIPFSLQWTTSATKTGSFIIKADYSIPAAGSSRDSAFTLATGLPPAIAVERKIRNTSFSLLFGYRFILKTNSENNKVFIDFLPIGFSSQSFKVSYENYNNDDYEVINPDVNVKREGLVASIGVCYTLKDFVFQVHAQTPILTVASKDYNVSYHSAAPLQLMIGYMFNLGKQKK